MVRVNLINPKYLTDQHLIAEYNEIFMLLAYIKKHPKLDEDQPKEFVLGKGHMKFFKDKLFYLKKRHDMLREEMKKRGFRATKIVKIENFPDKLKREWKPKEKDLEIIKKRIREKIRKKPDHYTYRRQKIREEEYLELLSLAPAG